ncbi:hypothetical protein GXW77_10205 [Roseomonas alkaliterrae]|uniref:Uncharacterized protein n=1 Tax=Neoroseomonas alkaliterrae TaxID=1452450 RepID=A0A840XTS6_9PROT|nr:hypothetical protein [Neoroseomonas alkaliterrae]MBB5691286.1 hypothetical protein [Neoroseomonas alkaliterrae]MBR0676545.1 hypothetical protein [Neoroseomonas alkaliterrae]
MSGLRIGLALVGAIVGWFLAFTFEADAGWTAGLAAAGAVIGWLLGGVRPGPGPGGLEPGAGAEG